MDAAYYAFISCLQNALNAVESDSFSFSHQLPATAFSTFFRELSFALICEAWVLNIEFIAQYFWAVHRWYRLRCLIVFLLSSSSEKKVLQ